MTNRKRFPYMYKNIWLKAWLEVANSSTCLSKYTPTEYADKCVEDYQERFEKIEKEKVVEKTLPPEPPKIIKEVKEIPYDPNDD